jgi:hypothetical protein
LGDKFVAQLRLVQSSNQDVLTRVVSLAEKIEAKLNLEEAHERSVHKGVPFEEVVQAELESIHGPLGDEVRRVSHDYGAVSKSQAGDFVVIVNPRETRGREVRIAVEAKTGKLTSPKAQAALDESIQNREAATGILVFGGVDDAPMGGRHYGSRPGGKFVVVYEPDEANPLALEVACRQARALAIASVESDARVEAAWLVEQCNQLSNLIERARDIKHGANAARRGLDKIDSTYDEMRDAALVILDEIKSKLD